MFDTNVWGIKYTESFTIPSSINDYLVDLSKSFDTLIVSEVTSNMKNKIPNSEHLVVMDDSVINELYSLAAGGASILGSSTGLEF